MYQQFTKFVFLAALLNIFIPSKLLANDEASQGEILIVSMEDDELVTLLRVSADLC